MSGGLGNWRLKDRSALALLLLAGLGGCGYVGDIAPPSLAIPVAVTDLVAVQTGDRITIMFTLPARTTDGVTIRRFREIDLRVGATPVPFDLERWAGEAQLIEVAPPEPRPKSSGPDDPEPLALRRSIPAAEWQGKQITIAVRTGMKENRLSSWSNLARLTVQVPLTRPVVSRVVAGPSGIVVTWAAPESPVTWRLLRQTIGVDAEFREIARIDRPEFTDANVVDGQSYRYEVIAMREGGEVSAVSPASAPSEAIRYVDIFPPAVPTSVQALVGLNSIELSWERSPEADLKGYFVFRAEGNGPFERLPGMVTLPAYSDQAVTHGKTYRYAVSVVDQKGNESAKSNIVEAAF